MTFPKCLGTDRRKARPSAAAPSRKCRRRAAVDSAAHRVPDSPPAPRRAGSAAGRRSTRTGGARCPRSRLPLPSRRPLREQPVAPPQSRLSAPRIAPGADAVIEPLPHRSPASTQPVDGPAGFRAAPRAADVSPLNVRSCVRAPSGRCRPAPASSSKRRARDFTTMTETDFERLRSLGLTPARAADAAAFSAALAETGPPDAAGRDPPRDRPAARRQWRAIGARCRPASCARSKRRARRLAVGDWVVVSVDRARPGLLGRDARAAAVAHRRGATPTAGAIRS